MKPILNMAWRLTLICAFAALALANVAEVTKGPIAESEARAQREAVEAVLPSFAQLAIDTLRTEGSDPVLYFSGVGADGPTGTAFKSTSGLGYSGEIEIILGLNPEGEVSGVRILRHAETPGLGANYAAPSMLDEFYKGRRIEDNWKLTKDGGQVDAVTGATITGRAIADAIESGLQNYQRDKTSIKAIVAPETKEGKTP
jgi:H+/Na+-translocating ferredoxin:NAD+ oxidoreductase subunit G